MSVDEGAAAAEVAGPAEAVADAVVDAVVVDASIESSSPVTAAKTSIDVVLASRESLPRITMCVLPLACPLCVPRGRSLLTDNAQAQY